MSKQKLEVIFVPDNCPAIIDLERRPYSCMQWVKIENKGRGMIATRDISKGELILKEKAIMVLPYTDDWPILLQDEFEKLSTNYQKQILGLQNCFPPITIDGKKVSSRGLLGIYITNSVYINKECHLFLEIRKFNHSCNYNVERKRSPPFEILIAKTNICAGEELCITYLNQAELRKKRKYRQEQLLETFNFVCECQRCQAENRYNHRKLTYNVDSKGDKGLKIYSTHHNSTNNKETENKTEKSEFKRWNGHSLVILVMPIVVSLLILNITFMFIFAILEYSKCFTFRSYNIKC